MGKCLLEFYNGSTNGCITTWNCLYDIVSLPRVRCECFERGNNKRVMIGNVLQLNDLILFISLYYCCSLNRPGSVHAGEKRTKITNNCRYFDKCLA